MGDTLCGKHAARPGKGLGLSPAAESDCRPPLSRRPSARHPPDGQLRPHTSTRRQRDHFLATRLSGGPDPLPPAPVKLPQLLGLPVPPLIRHPCPMLPRRRLVLIAPRRRSRDPCGHRRRNEFRYGKLHVIPVAVSVEGSSLSTSTWLVWLPEPHADASWAAVAMKLTFARPVGPVVPHGERGAAQVGGPGGVSATR